VKHRPVSVRTAPPARAGWGRSLVAVSRNRRHEQLR
jgi:hypothetical protein